MNELITKKVFTIRFSRFFLAAVKVRLSMARGFLKWLLQSEQRPIMAGRQIKSISLYERKIKYMKYKNVFKSVGLTMAGLAIGFALISSFGTEHSSAKQDNTKNEYLAKLRDGIGSEVVFPARGDSRSQVKASVE